MLVLSRRVDEMFHIGENITVMVVAIQGDKVKIGIEAPKHVPVQRREVLMRTQAEEENQSGDE